MSRKKADTVLLYASVAFFLLMALSFVLMPLGGWKSSSGRELFTVLAGGAFWVGLIGGASIQGVLSVRRDGWYKRNRIKKERTVRGVGAFTFLKNVPAAVADLVLVLTIPALIVSLIVTKGSGAICYAFISLLVFSFSMHCILNGKIYYYIKNQEKMLLSNKRERANTVRNERKDSYGKKR